MAWNTYDGKDVGNKEDVSDIITNIAPYDTPLYSRIGKTKATQTTHEWLEDTLGEAIYPNANVEGYTYSTIQGTERERLNNYTQIMHRGIHVTDSQEAVLHYGVRSEMAYQMARVLKELAFDCETAILNQANKVWGSLTIPREFGGLPYWIVSNTISATAGGGTGDLKYSLINQALEDTYKAGGNPSILLVSPRSKRIINTFTANATKHMDANKTQKITRMISVLETDFGILQCMTDRFMTDDVVYGLSPEYIKKAFLRNFKTGDMPKMNDMGRRYVNGEWTLEMRAEAAHFKIYNLNGAVPDED